MMVIEESSIQVVRDGERGILTIPVCQPHVCYVQSANVSFYPSSSFLFLLGHLTNNVTVYAKTNHMSAKISSRILLVCEATNVLNDCAKF